MVEVSFSGCCQLHARLCLATLLDAMPPQLAVKRGRLHPQRRRSAVSTVDLPARAFEGTENGGPFHLGERLWLALGRGMLQRATHPVRIDLQLSPVADNHRALNDVLELADIARPRIP